MKGWLTCSSIRRSRMIFRTLSDRTTRTAERSCQLQSLKWGSGRRVARAKSGNAPSSFRMYFSANDRPVSFLSTIRTFPKAPRPTTRRRRKWFRLTAVASRMSAGIQGSCEGSGLLRLREGFRVALLSREGQPANSMRQQPNGSVILAHLRCPDRQVYLDRYPWRKRGPVQAHKQMDSHGSGRGLRGDIGTCFAGLGAVAIAVFPRAPRRS